MCGRGTTPTAHWRMGSSVGCACRLLHSDNLILGEVHSRISTTCLKYLWTTQHDNIFTMTELW